MQLTWQSGSLAPRFLPRETGDSQEDPITCPMICDEWFDNIAHAFQSVCAARPLLEFLDVEVTTDPTGRLFYC